MKFAKRTLSILLSLLMLVSILPLSVSAASLKITTQPKTSYTAYGETAKATIKATGDGLKYTWYVKNAGASKYSKSSVTKSTYTAKMTDSVKSRSVYCVVKDKKGKTVKSSTAILRMKATITTEPKTTYAQQGATAKLTVKAKGDGLKYAWYIKNAGKTKYTKSSVTKSTYSVKMSDSVHGRYVYCVVTDKYGKTDKSKTVVLRQSATITTQPKTTSAALGETAKLTVKAKGDDLKYTWYIKNAGSSKYTKSSVTKSTYSVTMSEKVNGRYVYCVVTDKYGKTEKSKTVMLKLKADPLTITTQPQSTSASAGDQVGFGIVVKGGKAPYTYELQYTFDLLTEWRTDIMEFVEILKMGDMVEMAFVVSFAENYRYRIVVTDASGKQVISNEVTVEEIANSEPLEITRQPESTTASAGDEVGFGIEVTGGVAPYTYQLKRTNSTLEGAWEDVDAEALSMGNMTTLLFRISSKSFLLQDRFCIVVTDAEGNEVTSNVVWVEEAKEPLALLIDPVDVYAEVGDTVSFTVGVFGGTAPYTYHWQYMANNFSWTDVSGWTNGTDATLSFDVSSNEFTRGYQYRCIITDADGETLTTNAVSVKPKMFIVTQPKGGYAAVGEEISAFVEVEGGKGPYTYQWQYWTGSKWLNLTGETYNRLSLTMDQGIIANAYHYRCVITDATDTILFTEDVQFKEAMRIWIQPANIVKEVGSTATFQVAVTGGAEPYTYQWQFIRDGLSEWQNVGSWATGGTSNTMSFRVEGVSEWNYHHQYRCVITDASGKQIISDAAWVVNANALHITSQPVNDYGRHGQQCTFTVQVAGGTGPYTYQWQWSDYSQPWRDITNNEFYSGAKTNTLDVIVMEVDFDYETKYRCIITDAEGNQVITNAVWAIDY